MRKISISIETMTAASQFVLDLAKAGELKEEHKGRFKNIISELLEIVGDKKEIIKGCIDIAQTCAKEDITLVEIARLLWEIGEELKQNLETTTIRIMLVLHFYMELMKGKENGRSQRVRT